MPHNFSPPYVDRNTDLDCFSGFKLNTVLFKTIIKNEMQKYLNTWVKANIDLEPTKRGLWKSKWSAVFWVKYKKKHREGRRNGWF